jgi:cytochrome c oxidase subunit II
MEKRNRIALLVFSAALFGMLTLHGRAQDSQGMSAPGAPRVVSITAKRFSFEPNEITLKKGEPVTLQITSNDVTHGFFLRPLKIDEDIEPGKTTSVTVTPDKAGKFTLICDHLCGIHHGSMRMTVNVVE